MQIDIDGPFFALNFYHNLHQILRAFLWASFTFGDEWGRAWAYIQGVRFLPYFFQIAIR
jgi:hypothetical protein